MPDRDPARRSGGDSGTGAPPEVLPRLAEALASVR